MRGPVSPWEGHNSSMSLGEKRYARYSNENSFESGVKTRYTSEL